MEDQTARVAALLRDRLGQDLLALWLHGSAADSGLRPHSDLDLLGVIARPLEPDARLQVLDGLLALSGHWPPAPGGARPVELALFLQADLAPPAWPVRCEFLYGEWLRPRAEAGRLPGPGADPDHVLMLAQVRHRAQVLHGPAPAELLPEIPTGDIRRAIAAALPALLATRGDGRNVLLTLARMWHTLATGNFASKDAAASWAIPRLPAETAAALAWARDGYLAGGADTDPLAARWAVPALAAQVRAAL